MFCFVLCPVRAKKNCPKRKQDGSDAILIVKADDLAAPVVRIAYAWPAGSSMAWVNASSGDLP